MHKRWSAIGALLIWHTALASTPWTLGTLPSYYSGSFGTKKTIGIFYDPTYLQYQTTTLRLKLTVPYIAVSNLPRGAQLTGGSVSHHTASTKTTNASGLGDIWL